MSAGGEKALGPNPSGLCVCGCGQSTSIAKRNRKHGDIKGQPVRFAKNHSGRLSLAERFWSKVQIGGPDECWPWLGATVKGYGCIRVDDHALYAHRVSYELTNGPIPKGEGFHGTVVMHTCDSRLCCNPRHEVTGTQTENLQDMSAKCRGRNQNGPQRRPGGRLACTLSA